MAQTTTNLGKIHVFPSETLYNQFKDIIADNDLALLKDDGAYIVAALLEQNGYVKFSNGLILQWGFGIGQASAQTYSYPIAFSTKVYAHVCGGEITSEFWGTPAMVASITLTTFAIGAYGLKNGKIHWIALGY